MDTNIWRKNISSMPEISISDSLYSKYKTLAENLDGFDSGNELIEYVLSETATELQGRSPMKTKESVDDEAVQDRLKQLGYVE
ncbi:hypothetical protein V5735_22660 (plasmid) [Haladaptatus sp. SPP-AMP-3]|uniref:hypothetical protein n=1 Tax=Haladaptatus sp. SPP-AMP-3 TaxID=3121295 RepID=UPI003C2BF969